MDTVNISSEWFFDNVRVSDVVDSVETAIRTTLDSGSIQVARERLITKFGPIFNWFWAFSPDLRRFGFRVYSSNAANRSHVYLLFDAVTGSLLARINGMALGRTRTGAVTSVATRYLSDPNAHVAAFIGSGNHMKEQVEGILAVRPVTEVRLLSRDVSNARNFAKLLETKEICRPVVYESADEMLNGADIVTTMTNSEDPVFDARSCPGWCHLNAVGSNSLNRREVALADFPRIDRLVVDDLITARRESGDLVGLWDNLPNMRGPIETLADVIHSGSEVEHVPGLTVFESHGTSIGDLALASYAFDLHKTIEK